MLPIFQLPSDTDVETLADVHVDELPLYVNVPFTVTDHKILPDELLQVIVLCPLTEPAALANGVS